MRFAVRIPRRVEKDLLVLPSEVYTRVRAALEDLSHQPRPAGTKKLRGQTDTYRVRVGSYRIIYHIDDEVGTVDVLEIGHRRDVYR